MAKRTLDVIDVTQGSDGPRIGSVTLDGDTLTYEGSAARDIMKGWLRQNPPAEVFNHFIGWSNGAVMMRLSQAPGGK